MDRLLPLSKMLRLKNAKSPSPRPDVPRHDYEALFHDDYIRVCRLSPGVAEQPLQCELIEVPVHGCPLTYECLSYTWGEQEQSHFISRGNGSIPITTTLHFALSQLRPAEGTRDLWVDQICINQTDIAERGRQVQMMADVYRNAEQVVIWLGEASKDSDMAFKYVEQLSKAIKANEYAGFDDEMMKKHGLPGPGSKPWAAFGALAQRPWFSRAWVVQEISVAKSATVHCGSLKLDWFDLVTALLRTSAGASRHFGANLYHNGSPGERIGLMESSRQGKGRSNPFKVFLFAKNCDATNDADKLYAFTSLANLGIKTDYLRSVEEIYTTFAINFIRKAQKNVTYIRSDYAGRSTAASIISGFLCNAGLLTQRYRLPSWVPDWSVRQCTKPFWTQKTCPGYKLSYAAGGDALGDCEIDNSRGLHISVMMVDEVARTTSVDLTDVRNWSGKQLQQACSAWFTEASALAFWNGQSQYIAGGARNEAFIRTLVGDVDADGKPLGMNAAYAQERFQHFLRYINEQTCYVLFSPVKTDHVKERYAIVVAGTILGRSFFVTQQGFIGLGPYGMKSGDEVAVMLGGDVPLLVRKRGEGLTGPEYDLMGECYLHGVMFGQAQGMGCPVQRIVLK